MWSLKLILPIAPLAHDGTSRETLCFRPSVFEGLSTRGKRLDRQVPFLSLTRPPYRARARDVADNGANNFARRIGRVSSNFPAVSSERSAIAKIEWRNPGR